MLPILLLPASITLRATLRDLIFSACQADATPDTRTIYCPGGSNDPNVLAGQVRGHPDFERQVAFTAVTGPYPDGFPLTYNASLNVQGIHRLDVKPSDRIIEPTLRDSTAGIPKPVRCQPSSSSPSRCDNATSTYPQTSEPDDYFNAWYNDDAMFNRRAGFRQTLFLLPNTSTTTYQFNSKTDTPNAFYDPIRENNLSSQVFPPAEFEIALGNQSYSFTVEIHSFFQYSGTETFSFTGDDDVYVFINRILAIDIGGVHPRLGVSIALADYEEQLQITPGQIYEIDFFNAERHTKESNFLLTTTIVSSCNVASPMMDPNDVEWQLINPNTDLILIGGPTFPTVTGPTTITLMDPTIINAVSYAFLKNKFNLGTGFEFDFFFQASGQGGNGFSVLLHNRRLGLSNFNGGTGKNLGIKNLDRSIALAFDFCSNTDLPCDHVNQTTQLALYAPFSLGDFNGASPANIRVYESNIVQQWKDGQMHKVELLFYGEPNWLEVYVDESLRLRVKDFNPHEILDGNAAYVGFASSSDQIGGASIQVSSLSLRRVHTMARNSFDVDGGNDAIAVIADGKVDDDVADDNAFFIGTRDACDQIVDFGSADIAKLIMAQLVPSRINPSRRDLSIAENFTVVVGNLGNGNYSIRFSSLIQGLFDVHIAVGTGCTWDANLGEFVATNAAECWISPKQRTVEFLPPITASPTVQPNPVAASLPAVTNSIMIIAGGASGGSVAICCCLMFCLLGARQRWRREKKFVPAGVIATLERDVEMHDDMEMTNLANEVQKTAHRVLSFRAVSGVVKRDEEVGELEVKVKELKDGVKSLKRTQLVAEVDRTVTEDMKARPKPGSSKEPGFRRAEFAPTTVAVSAYVPPDTLLEEPPPLPPSRAPPETDLSLQQSLLVSSSQPRSPRAGNHTPSPTARLQRAIEAGMESVVVGVMGKKPRTGGFGSTSSSFGDPQVNGNDLDANAFDWKPPKPKGPAPPLPPSRTTTTSELLVTLNDDDDDGDDPIVRKNAFPPPPPLKLRPLPVGLQPPPGLRPPPGPAWKPPPPPGPPPSSSLSIKLDDDRKVPRRVALRHQASAPTSPTQPPV